METEGVEQMEGCVLNATVYEDKNRKEELAEETEQSEWSKLRSKLLC